MGLHRSTGRHRVHDVADVVDGVVHRSKLADAIPPTSALCSGVARNPWSSLGGNELLPRGKGKVGIPPWKRKLGDCGGFFSWKTALTERRGVRWIESKGQQLGLMF